MTRPWLRLSILCGGCLLLAPAMPVWGRLKTIKGDTSWVPSPTDTSYLVQTGPNSRAAIEFSDGSQVKLNANTTLEIPGAGLGVDPSAPRLRLIAEGSRDDPDKLFNIPIPARLVLLQGEVWEEIAPGRLVTTETLPMQARAEAEGTELNLKLVTHVAAANDTATLTVREGKAQFTNANKQVTVRKAERSQARPGQPPTLPEPVAGNLPLILEWTNELQPIEFVLEARFLDQDRQGQPSVAREVALREAEALPAGWERWQRLGDIRHDRGELKGALDAYVSARSEVAPPASAAEQAALEARIGQTLLESGKFREAKTAFQRSLELRPEGAAARAGLAVTLLNEGAVGSAPTDERADEALEAAKTAVGQDDRSPMGHTALALAWIRRGERVQAGDALARALQLDPSYASARAWHSYLLRGEGRLKEATTAAGQAVDLAPGSSLARQFLSDAQFALGRVREAQREAERAVALNPLSLGASISLVRALLQEGEIDEAVLRANKARELHPNQERARFFYGVVLAEQRDLSGAATQLEAAVNADPDSLEASVLLARVYLQQDQQQKAIERLRDALARDSNYAPARAALGRVYGQTRRWKEAVAEYQAALEQAPNSPLYHLELAQVYLDHNDLPDALSHALEALAAAPSLSEAHAVLGLVYDRQESRQQAVREYTEAISLSPDNSLARLGLVTSFTPASFGFFNSGQEGLAERAQALLRDPAVLEQTFKPGVTSEISGLLGADSSEEQQFLNRAQFSQGRVHDLAIASRASDDGYRANAGFHERDIQADVPVQATPSTQVLFQYLDQQLNGGLPGSVTQPDSAADARRHRLDANLHVRQYLGNGTYLWLQHGFRLVRNLRADPGAPIYGSDDHRNEHISELRLDHREGQHRLTYGLTALRQNLRQLDDMELRSIGHLTDDMRRSIGDSYLYFQDDYRLGDRGTLILGARWLRTRDSGLHQVLVNSTPSDSEAIPRVGHDNLLPYLLLAYSLDARNLLRVLSYKTRIRFDGPLLAPTEAFLVAAQPNIAYDGQLETHEIDFERRFSPWTFAQLFLQDNQARQLNIQPTLDQSFVIPSLTIPKVREQIAGLRFEQQISHSLTSFTVVDHVMAEDRSGSAYDAMGNPIPAMHNAFRGLQVPLTPEWQEAVGLNYVDRSGTKLRLTASFLSRQFTDVGSDTSIVPFGSSGPVGAGSRRTTGPRTQFDLRFAKEPRVELEFSLTVSNLFNTSIPDWPHYPRPGRRWLFNMARRF